MLSESTITETSDYDVVCIGNIAAVTGDILAATAVTAPKIAVLHLAAKVYEPSLPTSKTVVINSRPRGVDIFRQRVLRINPTQQNVVLQGGKKLRYRYLIHAEDCWQGLEADHPISEALSTAHSRVFSSGTAIDESIVPAVEGNLIFYVPKGGNSFAQNYPFFEVAGQMPHLNCIILVENDSFYPHCASAHLLLEQQLKSHKFKICLRVGLSRVDYLRRVFYFSWRGREESLGYDTAYCLIPQRVPQLLRDSSIDPYRIHSRLLHNLDHPSIFVFSADLFPTTHSFHAINSQMQVILKNITLLLRDEGEKGLAMYGGQTEWELQLAEGERAKIRHSKEGQNYQVRQGGSCWSFLFRQCLQSWLVNQFYNFSTFGLPHYFYCPHLPTEDQADSSSHSLTIP